MSTDPSPGSWFPTPPLKPPKPISVWKVVVSILVPLIAIAVVVVLVLTQKSGKPAAATGRSLAAFQACLKSQGALEPAERANARALQQDAEACVSHLPPGTRLPDFTAPPQNGGQGSRSNAFAQCVEAAVANSGGASVGRLGRPNRQAFENAEAMCRALTGSSGAPGGGSGADGPGATTPTTPVPPSA